MHVYTYSNWASYSFSDQSDSDGIEQREPGVKKEEANVSHIPTINDLATLMVPSEDTSVQDEDLMNVTFSPPSEENLMDEESPTLELTLSPEDRRDQIPDAEYTSNETIQYRKFELLSTGGFAVLRHAKPRLSTQWS